MSETRYCWWRDPRWLMLILVAATGFMVLWGLFGPESQLVVSRETTLITQPLRPDGTPDVAAHVLDTIGRGTPPEENAAVAVLRATWPMDLDAKDLTAVCMALGIPNTAPDTPAIAIAANDKALQDALRDFLGLNASDDGLSDVEANNRVWKLIDDAETAPWTTSECPPLAAWVARQSPALDLVVAGASRPKYEFPLPDLLRGDPGFMLLNVGMPDTHWLRGVCRVLTTRAMLHLGEGRIVEAWNDIHAVHRLSRLIAPAESPRFLITHLVAGVMENTATTATVALLESPGLSAAMVSSIRTSLEALPPLPDVRSSFAMERLMLIDIAMTIARMPRSERARGQVLGETDDLRLAFGTSLDWNAMLRTINAVHDRIETALLLPNHAARCRAVDHISTELAAVPFGPGGWDRVVRVAQLSTNRDARSRACARSLMGQFELTSKRVLDAYERRCAQAAVLRIVAALAEYRVRSIGGGDKPYPDSLDELVPEVLATVPDDPCSGGPFRYERRDDGYLLYSIGPDGTDDGGTNDELVRGEWRTDDYPGTQKPGDVAVRLPRPKRAIVPPRNEMGR